jgi:hypothetical protein
MILYQYHIRDRKKYTRGRKKYTRGRFQNKGDFFYIMRDLKKHKGGFLIFKGSRGKFLDNHTLIFRVFLKIKGSREKFLPGCPETTRHKLYTLHGMFYA